MTLIYKNYPGQAVYTQLRSYTGGSQYLIEGESSFQPILSKDGSGVTSAISPTAVTGHGRGIYSVILTQEQSNCDSGSVFFVVGGGQTAWWIADPIFFQTSDATPEVGLTTGTINSIVSSVKGATYDGGVSQEKIYEMLCSFMYGKVDLEPASGINAYTFRNTSGATSFASFCSTVDGTRLVGGLTGAV